MAVLDTFKTHFRQELEETGRKPPAEKEIKGIISAANKLFYTEKEEEDLASIEAETVQKLCSIAARMIIREGKEEYLTMLSVIFMYLRSHTIDKLDCIRRMQRAAENIMAEAKKCAEYDKKIAAVQKEKDPEARRKLLEDLRIIITIMGDIRKKAKDINEAIKIVRKNNDNVRLILQGRYREQAFQKFKSIKELLELIREFFLRGPTLDDIAEIKSKLRSLDSILIRQNRRIHLLKRKVKKIEKREEQVVRLMRRYKVAV